MTFRSAVGAELVKLGTLRVPVVVAATSVTLVALMSWGLTHLAATPPTDGSSVGPGMSDPAVAFLTVLQLAQAAVIVLAAWIEVQEVDSGSVRTALIAVPRRGRLLGAKLTVGLLVSAALSVVVVAASWGARCGVTDCAVPFSGGVGTDVRVLVGVVVYHALLGVLTVAVAAAVRHGVLGLCVVLALVLVVSPFALAMTRAARFLPDQAGAQVSQLPPADPGALGPVVGAAVLVAWTALAVVAAVVSLRRRSV